MNIKNRAKKKWKGNHGYSQIINIAFKVEKEYIPILIYYTYI